MSEIESGISLNKIVRWILVWFLQMAKTAVYSPVVLGFVFILVVLFFNLTETFPSITDLKIFQLLVPEEGNFDYKDMLSAYGLYAFIFSMVVSFAGVIFGKKFQLSRKKLFMILAGLSVVTWLVITFLLYYTDDRDTGFIGFGLFFGLVHLVCIAIGVLFSSFVGSLTKALEGSE